MNSRACKRTPSSSDDEFFRLLGLDAGQNGLESFTRGGVGADALSALQDGAGRSSRLVAFGGLRA
eukprot:CAMPEP_0195015970 /NCGR_PEP_ID=MMETSP0326_2-20130528/22353_1 /TAXON_ID=2866 ORGANISM="Crypthecodinium cohnii, Strain Seligo" /NCGR_SAMPLE_ID=MMETSP0326_2 /ASSEMBLY_ACC=CAM_ASM_000348 /LENGTH=64 /DNA_ID=CAMNT_0040031093 /DNA_START=256 /DNA_END=447 /DNA_ORIENTATION=+